MPTALPAMSRRSTLRTAAVAWVTGATALAGCGPMKAAPTPAAANTITLVWRPWYNFPQATSKTGAELLYEGTAPFRQAHPGVDIKITFLGYQSATVASLLGGDGPDVFEDWVIGDFTDGGLLLDLQKYIKQENLDLSVYPRGMIEYLQVNGQSAPGGPGFYALPDYLHTLGQAVNVDVVNTLGLNLPDPSWTYKDWADFWRNTSKKSTDASKRRIGGAFYWWSGHAGGSAPGNWYWHAWNGGFVNPNDNAQSMMGSPDSIAFGEYFLDLIDSGAAIPGGDDAAFARGAQVSKPRGSAGGLPYSAAAWRNVTWRLFPMPVGKNGRFTAAFESFYAADASTKQPDLCWEFIKWLCYGEEWPRYMMRLALQGPARKTLWEEWQSIVLSVAPPLAKVNLNVLVDQVQKDEMWTGHPFRFSETTCGNVINTYISNVLNHQMSVSTGFREAARLLDEAETVGAAERGAGAASLAKGFPTSGPRIAAVQPGL